MWFLKSKGEKATINALMQSEAALRDTLRGLEEKIKAAQQSKADAVEDARVAQNILADKEAEYKRSEEDIKHMVRITKERDVVAFEKKTVELEGKKAAEIAEIKDVYRGKLEEQLRTERDNVQAMCNSILARLPDISGKFKG